MKQEVSHSMKKQSLKTLTICILWILFAEISAAVVDQIQSQTHLRWNVFADKDHLVVDKKGNSIFIKTLNTNLFNSLKKDIQGLQVNKAYIRDIQILEPSKANNVGSIKVNLKDNEVELFSFYRDREKKYVLDFWVDSDEVTSKKAAIAKPKAVQKAKKAKKIVKDEVSKVPEKITVLKKAPIAKPKRIVKKKAKKKLPAYRDFRYGSSFVWDYEPLSPELKAVINIERKTPEHFYPIKNREYEKDEKEAHIQLSINMYRKKKWGLMYKSIKLYEQKYGEDTNVDINEYLKANAIIRESLEKGNSEPVKMAINMFQNIAERTKIYDLRKAVAKYLINYYLYKKEYVNVLQLSKSLYVDSKENFDYEESEYAAEGILFSLAKLGQIEQLEKLLKEKTIVKIIPSQVRLAYEMYAQLKLGNEKEVIKAYSKNSKGLKKPIHPGILYNAAEAYFRTAKYQKAIKLYDSFIAQHSYRTEAANSRLRIALSYEILERDIKQTLALYKSAINRSQSLEVSYEARLRYVGLRSIRKRKISEADREVRVFLDLDKSDQRKLNKDLKKLLWLVRMRSFIADKKFKKAMSYLNAIPVTSLKTAERRVFEADGAEIVYGIIVENYKVSNYSQVIRAWELYKEKYVGKVAADPLMNFLVGRSYIKLGLYDGFERVYNAFQKINDGPKRTFPIWNDRIVERKSSNLLVELKLIKAIKLKNWQLASKTLDTLVANAPASNKNRYYRGIIAYGQKELTAAAENFERFLSNNGRDDLTDVYEVAELIQAYTDAVYKTGDLKKFKKISKAILEDTKSFAPKHDYMQKVRERIAYLEIEILAGEEKKESYLLLEAKINQFRKRHQKSIYSDRVAYLLGLSFVANKKIDEGRKIFNEILNDKDVSNNIKELVRTELSLLEIKERTL